MTAATHRSRHAVILKAANGRFLERGWRFDGEMASVQTLIHGLDTPLSSPSDLITLMPLKLTGFEVSNHRLRQRTWSRYLKPLRTKRGVALISANLSALG